MKERVHWIDIAKGLMILGMVLNHIPNFSNKEGVDLSSFPWWITFGSAYGVFTMQSFFVLSGYTSNFDQSPSVFFIKQIKGLFLPYITFTLICYSFAHFVWGDSFWYDAFGEEYFFIIDSYWFLTALFIAKFFVYLIHYFSKNKLVELGWGIFLLIIGFAINELYSNMQEPSHYHNWFHYRNGLCMTIFITIGYYFRKYNVVEKNGFKISIVYTIIYCITFPMFLLKMPYSEYIAAPSYTHYFVPSLKEFNGFLMIPSYLFYTITGSVLVFWISQRINKWGIVEYMGKTSLIIYCVHFTFLRMFIKALAPYYTTDVFYMSSFFFFIIAVLTIVSSLIVAKIMEFKPLNYLIGKF